MPAADQLAAMIEIAALNHFVGDFSYLIIFAWLNDVAINFL